MIEKLLISQLEKRLPGLIEQHKDKVAGIVSQLFKELVNTASTDKPGSRCILWTEAAPDQLRIVLIAPSSGQLNIASVLKVITLQELADLGAAALLNAINTGGLKSIKL